jgi:hypothetical protein
LAIQPPRLGKQFEEELCKSRAAQGVEQLSEAAAAQSLEE